MEKIEIIQSKNIKDYKPILEGLVEDFGYTYYHSILNWCDIIDEKDDKFWNVYLIKHDNKIIGICGLYSIVPNDINELWLGWFGVLKEYRNKKIGEYTLNWMKNYAASIGCNKLKTYTDGKPNKFYFKNNFKYISKVNEYISINKIEFKDNFENLNDDVLECDIELNIKKCPFCGSDVSLKYTYGFGDYDSNTKYYNISCNNEKCFMNEYCEVNAENQMSMIDDWNNSVIDKNKNVNRLEIISDKGREFVKYDVSNLQLTYQDDGKTLKIFYNIKDLKL